MDLEELRAFIALAETGSHLAAADAIAMSRTTLRRKVDALEARAGVRLLERTPRGIVLTDAGQALAEQGRRMMQEMRAVLSSVRDLGVSSPQGVLRVVMPVGMPPTILSQIFAAMRATHPALRFHASFSNDPLRESLEDTDLAVHFSEGAPGPIWVSHPIMKITARLVATTSYLRERGEPRSIAELLRHELLSWEAPGEDPGSWPLRNGKRLRVSPVLVATDAHFIRSCALAGRGIALVPDGGFEDVGSPEPLRSVLEGVVGADRQLWVSVPKVLAETPKIRLILDQARALIHEST
ncbi:MAG: LysR family transcriptional regulator [Polyangiaceae bacterium]